MKKIDYVMGDYSELCVEVVNRNELTRKDLIQYYCPSDFYLKDRPKCAYRHNEQCESCWNEEVEGGE